MDPRAWRRFKRNRGAVVGASIVGSLIVFALLAPVVLGQDPLASDLAHGRTADGTPAPPSALHLLGTDSLFRDELSRLAHGARLSLAIAFAATALSAFIRAPPGIV